MLAGQGTTGVLQKQNRKTHGLCADGSLLMIYSCQPNNGRHSAYAEPQNSRACTRTVAISEILLAGQGTTGVLQKQNRKTHGLCADGDLSIIYSCPPNNGRHSACAEPKNSRACSKTVAVCEICSLFKMRSKFCKTKTAKLTDGSLTVVYR